MGGTQARKIQESLQLKYKPVRKYYDHFYGQVTVLQHRTTYKYYVKVEKVINQNSPHFQHIINRAKNSSKHFVEIQEFYNFPIDLCSANKMCIFIMEYYCNTLQDEILQRYQINLFFTQKELIQIYYQMIEGVIELKKIQKENKVIVSNDSFIYRGNAHVLGIETIFSDLRQVYSPCMQLRGVWDDRLSGFYISPQAFQHFSRGEFMKAKQIATQEKSIIFTLGMNFLQSATLINLSDLYNQNEGEFQFTKLKGILEQVEEEYGSQVHMLLESLTEKSPFARPKLNQVSNLLQRWIGRQQE